MRVAIAEEDGRVNQHFGRTRRFVLFDVKDKEAIRARDIDTSGLHHRHVELAGLLKETGVEAVIAGGIGPGAAEALEAEGLMIISGADGPVDEVARLYAEGKLVSKGSVCSHHHGHHH